MKRVVNLSRDEAAEILMRAVSARPENRNRFVGGLALADKNELEVWGSIVFFDTPSAAQAYAKGEPEPADVAAPVAVTRPVAAA